ncbi:hypothetical protein AB1E18_006253 [Capra hircus]
MLTPAFHFNILKSYMKIFTKSTDIMHVYGPFCFMPENSKGRSPLAFGPFFSGPRNCIKQTFTMTEMRMVLELTLLCLRILRDKESLRKPELILTAEGRLWLWVEPLSTSQ